MVLVATGSCLMCAYEICWYANKTVYETVITYLSIFYVKIKLNILVKNEG